VVNSSTATVVAMCTILISSPAAAQADSSGDDGDGDIKEIETGSWVDISVSDTLVFGPENQNELSIEFMRERESRDFRDMGIMPGIGPGTISDNPLRIIFPEGRDNGGLTETEFNSGTFRVDVEDFSVSEQSARVKILPVYSESSDFDCENYDLGENQYAFCSNTDEEMERGAEQEIDLGHTTEVVNFVRNDKVTGERYAKTGVNHLFVNPDSGRTVQFWQQYESTYKGAGIEIIEWRGLSDEHSGNNMQAIVEVDPVSEPDASLSFGKNNYETGEEINLNYEAFQPGRYELRVSGAGQDTTESYDESTTEDTLSLEVSEEGEINAELLAPGNWWNPLDSDRTVAEASAEVKRPFSEVNHEFGEKFSISEDQSTQIEGKNFYLSTLVGNSEDGYPSILWRGSEDSNTNSPLTLLRTITSMGLQYNDGFDPYGVVCSIDPETDSAVIVIKQNRFNPWEACDRHPDELRSDNDYEIKDYTLGEKVSLEPDEALEFGESRVYLGELEQDEYGVLASGYKEWVNEPASPSHWSPSGEGYSMTEYFYEGRIRTATCQKDGDGIVIVMQRASETGPNWPEAACENGDETNGGEVKQIETGSWVGVSVGDTLVFGPEDQNQLTVESIRERENRDFRDMEVMPGIEASSTLPPRVIIPEGRDNGGLLETEFSSGTFNIEVEDFSVAEQSAKIKIVDTDSGGTGSGGDDSDAIASINEGSVTTDDSQTTFSMRVQSSEANGIFSAYWETPTGDRLALKSNAEISPGETRTFTESVENSDINVETPVEVNANFGGRASEKIGTLDLENNNEDDTGEENSNSIDLETENPTTSSTATITASVTDSLDNRGYKIEVTGPDGFSLSKQQSSVSFEPGSSGQYTAKLLPLTFANGLPFVGELVQSGAEAETTFEVDGADTSAWIDYCNSNGYEIQSLDQDLEVAGSCVSEEIVPAFFVEGGEGQDMEVPESLCQDVLGTGYMENQRACGTPGTA